MATRVRHFYARDRRLRAAIPTMTREECLAHSADVRRAADIAAFMGDDQPASDFLHKLADDLLAAAKEKEANDGK